MRQNQHLLEIKALQLKPGDALILATHNQGKLEEIQTLLSPYGFHINSSGNLNIDEPEETEDTFEGNALLKAKYTAQKTGYISLADDSGLVVPALDGLPGVYSARWAGPNRDFSVARNHVHTLLGDKPRNAYFVCVLALACPKGSFEIFKAESHGTLTWPAKGESVFGYDSMFIPLGDTRTYAEMDTFEKLSTSARAKAFKLFERELLEKE